MNSSTLSIVLRAGYSILSQKNRDLDYVQVILSLLEYELEASGEDEYERRRTLRTLYRRLFRYSLKVERQLHCDDSGFDLAEMRLESRLTQYLRQTLMCSSDPQCPVKNQVVLTPDEMLALTTLRETCHHLREFEAQSQMYDFLESTTFHYKPIPALSAYMTNTRG